MTACRVRFFVDISRRFSPIACALAFTLPLLISTGAVFAQSSPNSAGAGKPEFVLLGTSRIGSRSSATLQLRGGKQVRVVSKNDQAVPLSGFAGYTVMSIESRRVSIRHPEGATCVDFPEQGVLCHGEGTTTLALRVRVNDRVAPDAGQVVIRDGSDLNDVPAEAGSFIDQLKNKAAERGERPEVPDGMELIETPSGFQLVPED